MGDEGMGRVAWFSGGTERESFVTNRVKSGDYTELSANEGGGRESIEYYLRGGGDHVIFCCDMTKMLRSSPPEAQTINNGRPSDSSLSYEKKSFPQLRLV